MGSSIKCFFSRGAASTPADVEAVLNAITAERHEDIRLVATRGRFSTGVGTWHLYQDQPGDGEPDSIAGEGPAGLRIDVYRRVVIVSSAERFHALYDDQGTGVAPALRGLLGSIARRLGSSSRIAVAAGGYGDTDAACDAAYHTGSSFEEVCAILEGVAGPPARTWGELAEGCRGWFVGEPPSTLALANPPDREEAIPDTQG